MTLQTLRVSLKGLSDGWVSDPDTASVADDLEYDPRGGLRECCGFEEIVPDSGGSSPFAGLGPVRSLFWFTQHNGAPQFLLWEQGTTLYAFNGSLAAAAKWDTLATGRFATSMPTAGTQYVSVGNNVWIVNGEDAPVRYDGVTTYRAGFAGPAPIPTADGFADGFVWGTSFDNLGLGDAATADTPGGGQYAYVWTEINEFGTESPPSPVAAEVKWETDTATAGSPATKYFVRVRIPPRSRTDIVGGRLYRTMNSKGVGVQDGVRYLLVQEIRGARGCAYVDDTPDSYLGAALDPSQVGPWPAGARLIALYKGVFFVAGMPSSPGVVAYSTPLYVENFPAANYFRVPDEVTGLYAVRNGLLVFCARRIFLITGDPVNGFDPPRVLIPDTGCSAPNTIREIPGVGLVFVSDAGVHLLTGISIVGDAPAQIVHISQDIQDFWKSRVNTSALVGAVGCVVTSKKAYWLALPVDGQPLNSMVYCYHYEQGFWTAIPDMPVSCMVETGDHRSMLMFGSADDATTPGVHYLSHWPTSKGGAANIVPTYRSNPLDLGAVYEHAAVKELEVRTVTYGQTVGLSYYTDRSGTVGNTAHSRSTQDPELARPIWGVAKWSATDLWSRQEPTVLRVNDQAVCKEYQWQAAATNGSIRFQLLGARIGMSYRNQKEIKAINTALATGTGS